MGDAFRGLTIRLGADARPLQSAISSITRSASAATKQFNAMNKALKLNPNNVAAMQARLDLVEDKAMLTARAAAKITTAMNQASQSTLKFSQRSGLGAKNLKEMAADTKRVYAANEKLHAGFTHVNADLQQIYDAMKLFVLESSKFEKIDSFKKANNFINALRRNLDDTGEKGKKVRRIFESIVKSTGMMTNVGQLFGFEKDFQAGNKLYSILKKLQGAQKDYQNDLEAMNKVEGFRAMKTQLIAYEAELRQAAAQAARFSAELHSLGTGGRLASAIGEIRLLDNATEQSVAHARQIAEAYRAVPQSVEMAKMKIASETAALKTLDAQLDSIKHALAEIKRDPAFDVQAAKARDAYTSAVKIENEYTELKSKILMAEGALERLNEEFEEMGHDKTKKSSEEFVKLKAQIDKDNAALNKMKAELASLDDKHATASLIMRFKQLESEEAGVIAKTAMLRQEISSLQHLAGNLRTMGYGLYSTVTPAILIASRYAIQSANDVDAAYRNMRKTVNGTEEEFEHLRTAALAFGRTHVTSADKILEIEAIGGQLSIAAKNLEAFSEVVSNLDIATNLDTETISQNLGQLSNIMKDMNQDIESGPGSLEAFSDALVRLGNNSAAQEDKIMAVMMRIASMGTISGMATPDLLALATATAATGQGAEAAGTALSRTFSNIESAVGKGGDKLEKFAEVSGMSAKEFADAWNNRPMEAFTAFINGLKRIDETGGSVANTLTELSINGVRQRQTLMGLTTTTDVLTNSLVMSNNAWNGVGDTWGDAGDAAREASRKAEGFSGQLQIMKNAAQELGVTLLDGTVPMLKGMTNAFQAISAAVAGMPDFGKSIVIKLAAATAAVGPLLVAFGALVDGAHKVGAAIETFKGMLTMRTASRTFITDVNADLAKNSAALKSANTALKANQAAINSVATAQNKSIAQTAASSATLKKYEAAMRSTNASITSNITALEADRAALEADKAAFEAAAKGAGTFRTAMKAIGATVGFMAILEVLGMVVSAIGEAVDKAKKFDQATRGLASTSAEFSRAARDVESGVDGQSSALNNASSAAEFYADAVNDAIEGNIRLSDTIKENKASADSATAVAEHYAEEIMRLNGNCENNAENLALLKTNLEGFNQAAGTSITIIDEKTGKLSVENDVIEKNCELLKKQAYAEAAKKNAEAATENYAKQQAAYNALLEERNQIEEKWEKKKQEKGYLSDLDIGARSGELTKVNNALKEMRPTLAEAKKASEDMWSEFNRSSTDAKKSAKSAADLIKEAGGKLVQLGEDADEASDELQQLEESVEDLCDRYPEFASLFNDAGLSVEEFSGLLNEMGLSMQDVIQGVEEMAEKVSDGFNRIELNSEMSLQKYMENLQHNKEVTAAWGDNLKELYNRSADETYRAWIREMAEAGPEYANVVAEMVNQDTETLMQEAWAWQDAKEHGVDAYLDAVGVTSDQAQKRISDMARGIDRILENLDGKSVEYEVDDGGTITLNMEKLQDLDRENLATKLLMVTDDGTVLDMSKKCKALNFVKIGDKRFYVTDDGTVYDEYGKVRDLSNEIRSLPVTFTTMFLGDTSGLSRAVRDANNMISSVSRGVSTFFSGMMASGAIIPNQAIRAIPRHADGGLNGIVTRATLTNVGWVGEAGDEALLHMRNAGGAIIPLSNRQHVRPFARAVAAEMGGASSKPNVTYNITLDYKAGDDANKIVRDLGFALRTSAMMEG